jgi:hypothetical protein
MLVHKLPIIETLLIIVQLATVSVLKSHAQVPELLTLQLSVIIIQESQSHLPLNQELAVTIMSDLPLIQKVLSRSGKTDSGTHSVVTTSGTMITVLQPFVSSLVTTMVTEIIPDRPSL